FTTNTSAISSTPALTAWIPSPAPGASSTTTVSASRTMSTSDCPTPTVSISTTSNPAASSTRTACGVDQDSPPSCPRVASERMKTPGSVACSVIRMRSPSSAPPENGDDGSIASTPTRLPCSRKAPRSIDVDVDLPTPGGPVSPMTCALPVYGVNARTTSDNRGWSSSTRDSKRETARGCPARARSTSSPTSNCGITPGEPRAPGASRPRNLHQQRVTLTTAAAQRADADAAAAPAQLVHQVHHQPSARRADRVAERDRTTVDVDLLLRHAELPGGHHTDGGERLVDLDQVQVVDADALLGQRG